MTKFRELPLPDELSIGGTAKEACRFFISEGHSFVSLDLELFENNGKQWGYVLADIASHVAKGLSELGDTKPEDIFREIESGYSLRMSNHLEMAGRHLGSKH
jgi:hypothetical protein